MHPLSRFLPKEGLWRSIRKHLNFYRVHLLAFTFIPLICSAIFFASNGRYHVSYIDALFNSVSAMTVCGLATINLSTLTGWQQTILFIQMCLGSPVVVSWVTVYLRKYYFTRKLEHIIEAAAAAKLSEDLEENHTGWPQRMSLFLRRRGLSTVQEATEDERPPPKGRVAFQKLRPDMIRRMEDEPKLVNPSGWVSEGRLFAVRRATGVEPPNSDGNGHIPTIPEQDPQHIAITDQITSSPQPENIALPVVPDASNEDEQSSEEAPSKELPSLSIKTRRLSDPGAALRPSRLPLHMQRFETMNVGGLNTQQRSPTAFTRSPTVEFAPETRRPRAAAVNRIRHEPSIESEMVHPPSASEHDDRRSRRGSIGAPQYTLQSEGAHSRTKHTGFGGFPMPHEIASSLFRYFFPKLQRRLTRTLTIPVTTTFTSQRDGSMLGQGVKPVTYISFDAIVGRNSAFHMLTHEQQDELGGIEYRALNALLWIVAGYHIGVQLISFIVIAPYMSLSRWSSDFVPPQQFRPIPSPWFSLFQVVSAYTNTGMSLVDQSMVPFQRAYPMLVFVIWCVLAGNTAFPIFLRLTIWLITKIVPEKSRTNETLHFLLDHPRRCFIYLFPSHQTWFLFSVLVILNVTDWFFFIVLDIGNPDISSIPLGVRFIIGLLQAVAVRAAGFGTVALSSIAPALKVLYVVMMYISVYPIAMSVRSTNVYEEKSLGIFNDDDRDNELDDDDENQVFHSSGSRVTVWSRYLAMHARKQLAFDMWWLALALFLVCIIERSNLDNPDNFAWFNIFNIVFELVSAYGSVGLSLGIPTQNYSFSGAFRPLSKLIVCAVMIRGRHRGLPVAIDRAVLVPAEYIKPPDDPTSRRRPSTSQGTLSPLSGSRTSRTGLASPNGVPLQEKSTRGESLERRTRRVARQSGGQEAYMDMMRTRSANEDTSMT